MSHLNGSISVTKRTAKDVTAALRARRYRQRKNVKENKASVTVEQVDSVTIGTAEMCALGARLSDGRVHATTCSSPTKSSWHS